MRGFLDGGRFPSRSPRCVANLGESTMSQCDVKGDENTYISCISILFGRFSEEFRWLMES